MVDVETVNTVWGLLNGHRLQYRHGVFFLLRMGLSGATRTHATAGGKWGVGSGEKKNESRKVR